MSSSWFTLASDSGSSSTQKTTLTRSILNDATSDDVKPTAGYLYDEIAQATNDPELNSRLVDYLIQRIKKQSPFTKVKVLKIIRKVCYKGHIEFRRAWQKNVSVVKEHEMFKGPADPLRGDEPNKAVREAAREAVEAIFDSTTERASGNSALASRIKGYGNTAMPDSSSQMQNNDYDDNTYSTSSKTVPGRYSSEQGGSSSSAPRAGKTKYEGIGNPNFRDPRNEPKSFLETVTDKVKEKVEKYSAEAATAVANASNGNSVLSNIASAATGGGKPSWMEGGSGVAGYGYASNRGPNNPISSTGSYDPNKFSSMPGSSSNGPWSSNGYSSNRVRKSDSDPRSPKNAVPTVMGIASSSSGFGSAASDGKYEQTLIDNLCPPGGIKAVPPADKLAEFCSTCKSLNPDVVMPILLEKLIHEDWKVQHKALCVCEAILNTKGCESFGDYIDNNIELVEGMIKSPSHSSVKERAKKIWTLLYEGEFEDSSAPSQPPATTKAPQTLSSKPKAQEPEVNLLDFSSDTPAAESSSGLDFLTSIAPPANNNNNSSNNTNGKTQSDSLFSNLEVKSSAAATNHTQTASKKNDSNDLDLLLLGTETIPSLATQTESLSQPASSGFSFISQNAPTPAAPQVLLPATSSAPASSFSFLNSAPAPSAIPQPLQHQQPILPTFQQPMMQQPIGQPYPFVSQQPIQQVTNQLSGVSLQNSFLSTNLNQFQMPSHPTASSTMKTSLNGQVITPQPMMNAPMKPLSMQQQQQQPASVNPAKPVPNPSMDDTFSFVKDQMKASVGSAANESQIGKKSKA